MTFDERDESAIQLLCTRLDRLNDIARVCQIQRGTGASGATRVWAYLSCLAVKDLWDGSTHLLDLLCDPRDPRTLSRYGQQFHREVFLPRLQALGLPYNDSGLRLSADDPRAIEARQRLGRN